MTFFNWGRKKSSPVVIIIATASPPGVGYVVEVAAVEEKLCAGVARVRVRSSERE